MNTVSVQASKTYDIHIGAGIISQVGASLHQFPGVSTVFIVSDSNVYPLYGEAVSQSVMQAGYSIESFIFPAGESSKNGNTYLELLNALAGSHMTRTDLIIALGGGVVGDLAGFAAATYLRGIRLIQIPTTLLAAVDSSVGGKTAIDLPSGKNLAGAFYQPNLVLCDTDTLQTLSVDVFRDGCAEVIKYALLYDPELFQHLQEHGLSFDREWVITRCIRWKRDAVVADEFDTGLRMKLNLGHTVGHGVEANSDYTVSHGQAVAIGTAIVARSAAALGYCTEETCQKICSLLELFGLPVSTKYSASALHRCALSDKKRAGHHLRLILPLQIGNCQIVSMAISEFESFIETGL